MNTILATLQHKIKKALYLLANYIRLLLPWRKPCVFLFGVPYHSNLGDQAQTYCILKWLRQHLPHHQHVITMLTTATNRRLNMIRRVFRKGDILLCHSGYHMTDLYHEKDIYEKIAKLFPEEELRIMPQTVFFEDTAHAKACAKIFNTHGNCTLLCRDALSYETAKILFSGCKLHLYPDIVTSQIGVFPVQQVTNREGILFCMRNDKEALYSKEQIKTLHNKLKKQYPCSISDTTITLSANIIEKNREKILASTFEDMAKYRVVVTDRYHGTIFSLIANTPVIVINSTDHKLSSGVKWFPDSFRNHVFFAENLEEVPELIARIMQQPHPAPLPPYFEENYYGKTLLKTLLLESYA